MKLNDSKFHATVGFVRGMYCCECCLMWLWCVFVVNFEALLIAVSIIAGLLIISLIICICCFYRRCHQRCAARRSVTIFTTQHCSTLFTPCVWLGLIIVNKHVENLTSGYLVSNVATLRSGICYHKVVCNVNVPYSGGWNFRQYFSAVFYHSHPLTSVQNFTEIVRVHRHPLTKN